MFPKMCPQDKTSLTTCQKKTGEEGFSLVEVIVAMVVLLVALLGVFAVFTFSVNYNAGNSSRAQALAVLQQETELIRSAKFTPYFIDPMLKGGVKVAKTASANGSRFSIETTVDDDPFAADVQTDDTKTLKEITITVRLESPTAGWQTAVPATTILRRVRSN